MGTQAEIAVRLFVERASRARPGFEVTDHDTAEAVVAICKDLDGLPLGIEQAAARMESSVGHGCTAFRVTQVCTINTLHGADLATSEAIDPSSRRVPGHVCSRPR